MSDKKGNKGLFTLAGIVAMALIGSVGCEGKTADAPKSDEAAEQKNSTAPASADKAAVKTDKKAASKAEKKPAAPKAAQGPVPKKMGETITFDDSEWVVLSARVRGNKLKSNNRFQKPKTTTGYFAEVKFRVTNKAKKEKRVIRSLKVRDAKGREFNDLDSQTFYIPKGGKSLGLEALPPSMPREFYAIFEVPPDANGLVFMARSLDMSPKYTAVALGLTAPKAVAGTGDSPKAQKAESGKIYAIGDTIAFKDSKWKVLKAEKKSGKLKANNRFQDAAQSDGYFVRVQFEVTNTTAKEERVMGGIFVVDSVKRAFGTIGSQSFYVPKKANTIGLKALPSSMPKVFWAVFEVAPDAHKLHFQARSLSLLSDHALVDLKLANPKTPAPPANPARLGTYKDGKVYAVGDIISFKDSDWKVIGAASRGQTLKSSNRFSKPKTTSGQFIQVQFEVTNRSKKPGRVMGSLKAVDQQGREFKTIDMQGMYVPKGSKTMTLASLPPSMKKTFYAIFEVPPKASGIKFMARGLSMMHDSAPVNLGL